ncbi:MAG: SusD/RagB family nutrient-binding outer membrane lipoprotein [Chitinophagaceae bacterium]|nr:MAG: SusD/RagB family nutrient-binding outer membrane lipoprotein [Chitinophagaceae bacterium]
MKNIRIKNIFYGLAVVAGITMAPSCSKIDGFGDLNSDPSRVTEPPMSALLTNVLANFGNNIVWDQGGANTVAGLYVQYFSETQYTETSRYATPTFNWDTYYSGPLYDLQTIINYNSDAATASKAAAFGNNANQIAIARILKVHYFKFLTDMVGDVPYTQALKGETGEVVYDKQETIYPALITELKEAAAQINVSAGGVQGDLLYSGNMSRWVKYANSLRALLALNMVKANQGAAATEFAAAVTAGVIEENADNATIVYPGGNFPNVFYNYYNVTQRKDYAVSQTFVNQLNGSNDPRITALATTNVGFPYGLTRDQATAFNNSTPNWARVIGSAWNGSSSALPIITAAHMWLARAEAAFRTLTTENVATAYSNGVQRSWQQWGVYNAGTFGSYIASFPPTSLETIAKEEWVSWYPNGLEGWNVYRRTGFPTLTPAANTGTAGIPRRFPYGSNDFNLNSNAAKEAEKRYQVGGINNSPYGRIWWDK